MFILCHAAKNEPRKRAKGSNTPWHPARLVALAIFWWLPKGVIASAIFAQRNPKISLLLQAGYHFFLHSVPLFKAKRGEKHIGFLYISRRTANTSGRYAKAKHFAGFLRALGP
ncbi:MAG: hypothetical protein IJW09_02445 [Clostridia bacterium]|nr:hypothetical protein [Clostridia bacterium]